MNHLALGLLTKDRCNLTRQTIRPLLQPDKFDLFWFDGSSTEEGKNLWHDYRSDKDPIRIYGNVLGGPDAAIVYALTTMLGQREHVVYPNTGLEEKNYKYIAIIENDVLLDADWFSPTMGLFVQGAKEGLDVGAVSARAYEDRVLIQRDGYAVMHNIGAGFTIFTREAAELVLANYRTGLTTENRRIFSILSDIDIAAYWCFRGSENWTSADWQFDRILAAHGLASLALNPCKCNMIGQDPPLEQQGLKLIGKNQAGAYGGDEQSLETFRERAAKIRGGDWQLFDQTFNRDASGVELIFPHQMQMIGGACDKAWHFRWSQGFGPFVYVADKPGATITIPVLGACEFLCMGNEEGGGVQITTESGFDVAPKLPAVPSGSVVAVSVPGANYRMVTLTALDAGVQFFGVRCRDQQPRLPNVKFDFTSLPPVG